MTIQTEYAEPGAVLCAPRAGTLYDVLELILDRGMVIDIFVRVSLVGIEILKIDARVVVASVDTYLRFAEACNRIDLSNDSSSRTVPELFAGGKAGLAGAGAKRAIHSVGDKVKDTLGIDGGDEEEYEEEREPARRRSTTSSRRRRGEAA
jgi:hypothetical protein